MLANVKRSRGRPRKGESKKPEEKALLPSREEPQRRRSSRNLPITAPATTTAQPVLRGRKTQMTLPKEETAPPLPTVAMPAEASVLEVNPAIVVPGIENRRKTKPIIVKKSEETANIELGPAPTPIKEETQPIINSEQIVDNKMNLTPRSPTPETQMREPHSFLLDEVARCGGRRKRTVKLIPPERMLLAQLFHDNFLLYSSHRYARYDYIFPETNLRQFLASEWAERLTKLGTFHRTADDIQEKIRDMILEVQEYRSMDPGVRLQMTAIQSAPSFILFNKIFDYISLESPEMENLLDKYEFKQILNRGETYSNLENSSDETLLTGEIEHWSSEETSTLAVLYNQTNDIYNRQNPLHQEGFSERQNLLKSWINRNQKFRLKSPLEIERQIVFQRKLYYDGIKETGKHESTVGEFLCNGWTERLSSFDLTATSLDSVLAKSKEIQERFLSDIEKNGMPTPKTKTFNVIELPSMSPLPMFEVPANSSCRTNRPHMSRRERHLLAMLYRKNHKVYEHFNAPHVARKSSVNKKWSLLQEWADLLTTLGVSQRDPEELSTKISQYKNIVKNRKRFVKKGSSISFKSEYKMRKICRPLSPITKFFDLSDESKDLEATDEKIKDYLETCHTILHYPFNSSPPISPLKKKKAKLEEIKAKLAAEKPQEEPVEVEDKEAGEKERVVQTSQEPGPSSSKGQITVAEYVMHNFLSTGSKTQEENPNNFENIFSDCKQMAKLGLTTVAYDVIDPSGQVIKMAISREENLRDVNFFLWTKCMDLELDTQLAFYVCYMCETMSSNNCIESRYRNLPGSGILAQQALPTMAVAGDIKQVQIRWSKSPPKHRCVPFLMSTVCEKLASLGHIIRTTEMEDEKKKNDN